MPPGIVRVTGAPRSGPECGLGLRMCVLDARLTGCNSRRSSAPAVLGPFLLELGCLFSLRMSARSSSVLAASSLSSQKKPVDVQLFTA